MVDPRDRVVMLTADDLDAILEAIGLAIVAAGTITRSTSTNAAGRVDAIIEQLRGRHDLDEEFML